MKEYLTHCVRAALTPIHGRNVVREYLQARILGTLQRAGAMIPLAFQGGTSLRFLYFIPRYSEDLDFTLERAASSYDLRAYLWAIRAEMAPEGYAVELRVNDKKTVHHAFIRFAGLLHELGLSQHRQEALSIRIEIDTNPPAGAVLTTSLVRRHHVTLRLQHHDRASLLSGKLHAILWRPYAKGRDIYDLLWYLSDPDWPAPNLTLLNNALQQTGWRDAYLTEHTWRGAVCKRLQTLAWDQLVADVHPFLEPGTDPGLLTRENVMLVLGCEA
ncbi:MAG: nucleotidyl transferase AbiEii/AbiGii toxin family protein [Nitrospinae bacterium]|nr:nucleotidyl transferase AbiEii/AbiGii toxin family protein [Nitrospinota bacterium]